MSSDVVCFYVLMSVFTVVVFVGWYIVLRLLRHIEIARIFISYRRSDGADVAGRIYQDLRARYPGSVIFFDVDGIHEGDDYRDVLVSKVSQSDIVVAVVGPHWDGRNEPNDPPRILRIEDWVRTEVEHADTEGKLIITSVRGQKDIKYASVPDYNKELKEWEEDQAWCWLRLTENTLASLRSADVANKLVLLTNKVF